MDKIECTVLDSFAQVSQSLEKEWDDTAARTFAGIYMTYRWSQIWWEFYGGSNKLRIYFFRQEGKLVAVFPIYIQRIHMGLVSILIARLVGSNIPPKVFDPPVERGQASEMIGLLIRKLVKDEACDLISLGPVSEQWANRTGIQKAAEQILGDVASLEARAYDVYTFHDLPNSFDELLSSLSQKERRIRRQKMNIFNKDFKPQVEVLTEPSDIEAEILPFMELHNVLWKKEGMSGYFGAWPKATAFNKKLAQELAAVGRTWLMKVVVDNKPVLYQYAFVIGDKCHWISSAREFGETWERYSLGVTSALFFLRHCIEKGVKWIESGLGSFEYKTKLGGVEAPTIKLRFTSKRLSSRIKYLVFRFISTCITILYHKIYYNRIQPRLPVNFRRPIWIGWLHLSY